MSDDGEVLTRELRQGKDATHSRQLLTREATHDACLTEERFHGRVTGCQRPRVTRCSPAATFRRPRLDGSDTASFPDERRGMIQQFVRVGNVFDIQQLHQRVFLLIEMLVHILQYGLNTNLFAVAYRPHRIER